MKPCIKTNIATYMRLKTSDFSKDFLRLLEVIEKRERTFYLLSSPDNPERSKAGQTSIGALLEIT